MFPSGICSFQALEISVGGPRTAAGTAVLNPSRGLPLSVASISEASWWGNGGGGCLLATCRHHKISNLLESLFKLLYPNISKYWYFIFAINLKYLIKLLIPRDEQECIQVSYSLQIKENTHHCTHAPPIQNIYKLLVSQPDTEWNAEVTDSALYISLVPTRFLKMCLKDL